MPCSLEFVDPLRQTDRTLEIDTTYGLKYIEDMIIIDGRIKADNEYRAATGNGISPTDEAITAKRQPTPTTLRKNKN